MLEHTLSLDIKAIAAAFSNKAFPFLADPPEVTPYKGIIEFPGFHTTTSATIASMYALGRVTNQYLDEDENGVHYVTDYPVVVALDMSGLEKHIDYDAAELVRPVLEDFLREILNELGDDLSDDAIVDAAYRAQEYFDYQSETALNAGPLDFLSENTFMHFQNPLGGIMDDPSFPDMVRNFANGGKIPDSMIMAAADQFRYVEDVPESHVVAVYFVPPIADKLFDYDDTEEEFEATWPGFDIVDTDDAYGGYWSPSMELVWGSVPPEKDVEYHGTTYKRFKQAAPEINIPEPPSPPYYG